MTEQLERNKRNVMGLLRFDVQSEQSYRYCSSVVLAGLSVADGNIGSITTRPIFLIEGVSSSSSGSTPSI
jgi:hypothetical protein